MRARAGTRRRLFRNRRSLVNRARPGVRHDHAAGRRGRLGAHCSWSRRRDRRWRMLRSGLRTCRCSRLLGGRGCGRRLPLPHPARPPLRASPAQASLRGNCGNCRNLGLRNRRKVLPRRREPPPVLSSISSASGPSVSAAGASGMYASGAFSAATSGGTTRLLVRGWCNHHDGWRGCGIRRGGFFALTAQPLALAAPRVEPRLAERHGRRCREAARAAGRGLRSLLGALGIAFHTSSGLEMCDRSILVRMFLRAPGVRGPRVHWRKQPFLLAVKMGPYPVSLIRLQRIGVGRLFGRPQASGSTSRMARTLTSSSLANSLIRIFFCFIRPFLSSEFSLYAFMATSRVPTSEVAGQSLSVTSLSLLVIAARAGGNSYFAPLRLHVTEGVLTPGAFRDSLRDLPGALRAATTDYQYRRGL